MLDGFPSLTLSSIIAAIALANVLRPERDTPVVEGFHRVRILVMDELAIIEREIDGFPFFDSPIHHRGH